MEPRNCILFFQAVNSIGVFGRLSGEAFCIQSKHFLAKIGGMPQMGWLVGFTAMRNWRQIRSIRFDHKPIYSLQTSSVSNPLRILEGDYSRKASVATSINQLLHFARSFREAVKNHTTPINTGALDFLHALREGPTRVNHHR